MMQRRQATEIPPRRSATQSQVLARRQGYGQQHTADTEDAYPDERRMPSSAVRWRDTTGNQVIQRGNKRIIIHNEPPPRRRPHWLLIFGIGMMVMVLLWGAGTWLSNWWTNHQLDATYGMPRTWQTDQVVGHSDSTDHPTHFIFLNLDGQVKIIELPGGDSAHARIYGAGQIYADNAASVPVTGEFKDVNGDGKVDMIVHIGEQRIVFLNDGTQFKPQQP